MTTLRFSIYKCLYLIGRLALLLTAFWSPAQAIDRTTSIFEKSSQDLRSLGIPNNDSFRSKKQILEKLLKIQGDFKIQKTLGGVDSGGGTLVASNGKKILLDLANAPNLNLPFEPSQKLRSTNSLTKTGIEIFDRAQSPAFSLAKTWIEQWAPSSPIMSPFLSASLRGIPLFYSRLQFGKIPANAHFTTTEQLETAELAAIYVQGVGTVINKSSYESVDGVSQAALLLHEILRHVQIGNSLRMSNENLQKLTVAIIQGPQKNLPSLDGILYIWGGKIQASGASALELNLKFENLQRKACLIEEFASSSREFCLSKMHFSIYEHIFTTNFYEASRNFSNHLGDLSAKIQSPSRALEVSNLGIEVSLLHIQSGHLKNIGDGIEFKIIAAEVENVFLNEMIGHANQSQKMTRDDKVMISFVIPLLEKAGLAFE